MLEQRFSDNDESRRTIPSFIEPRPPLIQNPFMRPRPQKGTNLLELFDEDSDIEEPELVQVYLRLKPCKVPNTLYEIRSDRCLVTSLDTATAGHGRRTQHNVSKMYTFSKIFGAECNQKEIFESVVKHNLRKLPDGHNFTLLTYGASGSGKTYTLMGTVGAPGLVPRSLEYVFQLVDAAQQPAFRPAENGAEKLSHHEQDFELQWVKRLRHVSAPLRDKYRRMSVQLHSDLTVSSVDLSNRIRHYVWVSFVEIYNEAVYDLLAPPDKRTNLKLREDSTGNVYVKGAMQAFVRSGEEAYDVMVAGKHNLVVAATGVHAHSSRSHCIFTITMLTETGDGSVRTSYVRLCDLAGCERAHATGNKGARMAESRAINSSLHVLERCLHMLRRKQKTKNDAMVPYRESKLTRLLGTGLSGARGEAVSMVVTLNPSPQHAHVTKHVLSLAAVAQDIQINYTMLASTLDSESSVQDSTIGCSSAELMRLRSDNERLHFELVQSQARNKELLAAMEEHKQKSANTMRELVEEVKDMTKEYYEDQLATLRREMIDMVEEYESRLAKTSGSPKTDAGMPSRFLQNKVSQMTEIAVLEEKITAETLKRVRAEKEVEHLRACLEERDNTRPAKDTGPPREDVISLSDSENESDEETNDPLNESLEPIFSKELNRSISVILQNEKRDNGSVHTIDNIEEECDSELEKSHETRQNNDSKNSSYATGEDEDDSGLKVDVINDNSEIFNDSVNADSNVTYHNDGVNDKNDESKKTDVANDNVINSNKCDDCFENNANVTYDNIITSNKDDILINDASNMKYGIETTYEKNNERLRNDSRDEDDIIQFKNVSFNKLSKPELRGTYFVRESQYESSDSSIESMEKKPNSFRDTYFANDPVTNVSKNSENYEEGDRADKFKAHFSENSMEKKTNSFRGTYFVKDPVTNVSKNSESYEGDKSDQCKVHVSEDSMEKKQNSFRGTSFVKDPVTNVSKNSASCEEGDKFKLHFSEDSMEKKTNSFRGTYFVKAPVINVSKNSESYEEGDKSIQKKEIPIVREKSNVEMKSPKPVTEERTSKIVREKSNTDMKVTETFSEPISKVIRGKSNIDMKAPETVSSLIRAKTNINMKATEKVPETLVGKIMRSFKSNQGGSDVSLTQFEQLEKASKETSKDDGVRTNQSVFGEIKIKLKEKRTYFDNVLVNNNKPKDIRKQEPAVVKEKRTYFDNIGANVENSNKKLNNLMDSNDDRSPSIVKDVVTDDFEPSTIKKLLGESLKPEVNPSTHTTKLTKKHISVDIFEGFDSPVAQKTKEKVDEVEIRRQSIEKLVLDQLSVKKSSKANLEPRLSIREVIEPENYEVHINKEIKLEPMSSVEESNGIKAGITREIIEPENDEVQINKEIKLEPMSSVEESNGIRAGITREAKFEPASSTDEPNQTMNYSQAKGDNTAEMFENIYKDITTPRTTEFDMLVANESTDKHDQDETKYNLRKARTKVDTKVDKSKDKDEEILAASHAKSEVKGRKRPLRLRRRKNQDDESGDDKLKDIVNLQSEFSDVTMGMPATKKDVIDIPSPEKGAEENLPPLFGIQSCPSKSVTRSRRKLFTPRAEPLEESLTQTGDSNERIYVPRPSYHRPRARRKL